MHIPHRDVLSSESPLHSNSSIFLVIILVTSWRSSFSLSKFELAALAVRVSRYKRAVLDIKVSEHFSRISGRFLWSTSRLTKSNKRVRLSNGLDLSSVSVGELFSQFLQVWKGKFSRVRLVCNSKKHYILCDEVTEPILVSQWPMITDTVHTARCTVHSLLNIEVRHWVLFAWK